MKESRIATNARVKLTTLATIHSFLMKNGIVTVSRSDLIHEALELFKESIVMNGKTPPFTSIDQAYEYLSMRGFQWGKGTAGEKAIIEQLMASSEEEMRRETIRATGMDLKETLQGKEDAQRAYQLMQEQIKRNEERKRKEITPSRDDVKKAYEESRNTGAIAGPIPGQIKEAK